MFVDAFLDLLNNPIVTVLGAIAFLGPFLWERFKAAAFAYQEFQKEYRRRDRARPGDSEYI